MSDKLVFSYTAHGVQLPSLKIRDSDPPCNTDSDAVSNICL